MKKVYTILVTREVSRYEDISAENIDDAIKTIEDKIDKEKFIVSSPWNYQNGQGIYNMTDDSIKRFKE